MTVYIFTRHKKKGTKKVVQEVDSIEEARKICQQENLKNQQVWHEFTEDFEWTKEGGRWFEDETKQ
jgi:hypothetical protein